jgi:hypothetical protein
MLSIRLSINSIIVFVRSQLYEQAYNDVHEAEQIAEPLKRAGRGRRYEQPNRGPQPDSDTEDAEIAIWQQVHPISLYA